MTEAERALLVAVATCVQHSNPSITPLIAAMTEEKQKPEAHTGRRSGRE